MQQFIVGEDIPIVEAVEEEQISMGAVAWTAMRDHIKPFIDQVRQLQLPIFHTRVLPERYDDPSEEKLQIVEMMEPAIDEVVIDKPYPSAFYGTDLLTRLITAGIDTVVVVGNTTSGCIRATVIDAQQYGFHIVIPEECVFDRLEASHSVSLLDMWMKYAEVLPTDEVVDALVGLTDDNSPEDNS